MLCLKWISNMVKYFLHILPYWNLYFMGKESTKINMHLNVTHKPDTLYAKLKNKIKIKISEFVLVLWFAT